MTYALSFLVILLASLLPLDVLRRKGALVRPEFYLLITIYLYSTVGYVTYLFYPPQYFVFMLAVDERTMHVSYLYSVLALLAIYVGGRLYRPVERTVSLSSTNGIASLAAAGCLLALATNFYYFFAFGFSSGGFNRTEFIDEFKAGTGFAIPYMSLLLASITVLALYERGRLSWLVFAMFALLHLPVGDRRVVLSVFIVLLTAKLLRGARFGRKSLAAIVGTVALIGILVGNVRAQGLSAALSTDPDRLFLSLSEFARPFTTLLYYVDTGYSLLWGRSFAEGVVNIVPSFLLPFDKFVSLGQEFRDIVASLGLYADRVSGYGFFPVAEVLVNFGPLGILIVFFVLAALLQRISRFAVVDRRFCFLIPIFCSAMFSFGRSSFMDILVTYFWVVIFAIALHTDIGLRRYTPRNVSKKRMQRKHPQLQNQHQP